MSRVLPLGGCTQEFRRRREWKRRARLRATPEAVLERLEKNLAP
jgi:hypothetical protein